MLLITFVQISPLVMIDKITSRLGSQKLRPQSVNENDEDEDKDELQVIDEILTTSRKHQLAELPPAPRDLSPVQVSNCYYYYCLMTLIRCTAWSCANCRYEVRLSLILMCFVIVIH